jgi:hypothetical protein
MLSKIFGFLNQNLHFRSYGYKLSYFLLKENQRDEDNKKNRYTKSNLPSKDCEVCGRPFEWRKKWEKVNSIA